MPRGADPSPRGWFTDLESQPEQRCSEFQSHVLRLNNSEIIPEFFQTTNPTPVEIVGIKLERNPFGHFSRPKMTKIDPVTDVTGFLDYPSTRARVASITRKSVTCVTPLILLAFSKVLLSIIGARKPKAVKSTTELPVAVGCKSPGFEVLGKSLLAADILAGFSGPLGP